MKKIFFISLFIFSFSLCEGQSWMWAKQGSGSLKSNVNGSPVATDKNGNAYFTGSFYNFVVFGTYPLNGYGYTAYLVKYDSNGNVLWAKQPNVYRNSSSFGTSIATDESGNIYIAGNFGDTISFGSYTLTATNSQSVFLVKYDASGSVLWAKQAVLPSVYSRGKLNSVCTDNSGNVFITGYFDDTISFGPYTLICPKIHQGGIFLVKYDLNGNILWAKQSDNLTNNSFGESYAVTADKSGNSYITGSFNDTVSFGSHVLTNPTSASLFVVKYSPSGNIYWAKQSLNSSPLSGSNIQPNSIITDSADNSYITGYYLDTVSFGWFTLTASNVFNNQSTFLVKYDSNGNPISVQHSSPGWVGTSLAIDNSSHIYLVGVRYNNTDTLMFGNFYSLYFNYSNIYTVSFLVKFDMSLNPICGSIVKNLGDADGIGVASDSSGKYIYVGGPFYDSVICATDTLFDPNGEVDVFAGRWKDCSQQTSITTLKPSTSPISIFPNPSSGIFTIAFVGAQNPGAATIEIYNVMGEKVYSQLTMDNGQLTINLSDKPNGLYFYRVLQENGTLLGEGKMIIQK